jgi:hypothetical protein
LFYTHIVGAYIKSNQEATYINSADAFQGTYLCNELMGCM